MAYHHFSANEIMLKLQDTKNNAFFFFIVFFYIELMGFEMANSLK